MNAELGAEQQRLVALARVNPNVRDEEIDQLAVRRELIAATSAPDAGQARCGARRGDALSRLGCMDQGRSNRRAG